MSWVPHFAGGRENRFRGVFRTNSPLRIGSGRGPLLGTILRIRYAGREIPYVPGSSLKGVFRNFAYTLVRAKGLFACGDNNCLQNLKKKKKEKEKESEISLQEFYESACLLCKIFGTQGYRSKVTFFDAYPLVRNGQYIFSFGKRPGIKVGRKTGAAAANYFYEVEYVEPGSKFRFEICCSNLPNYALGLLSRILLAINLGEARIGGLKSRGFGEVFVEELEFTSTEGKTMNALDPKDRPVELPLSQENGWIARGKEAWEAIEKLAGVWDEFKG